MKRQAVIGESIGSEIYPYSVVVDGISLFINDPDENIRVSNVGDTAIVDVTPSESICEFICFFIPVKEGA